MVDIGVIEVVLFELVVLVCGDVVLCVGNHKNAAQL